MKYFEVGQTVYHQGLGEGLVVDYYRTGVCPIIVEFKRRVICTFTEDGKMFIEGPVTLSQNPIPPIVNTFINEFKQGELVWVKSGGPTWEVRYYSHFDPVEEIHRTFDFQKKEGGTSRWIQVKKFEDNPLI
jgi:hypothetical protein